MKRVFVTDGEERASLAIVRSLGAQGYEVFVGSNSGRSLAGASRYCRSDFQLPSVLEKPDQFISELSRLLDNQAISILIPVSEGSLRAVLPRRNQFSGVTIPFPENEAFEKVSDKEILLRRGKDLGLAVPEQWSCDSHREIDTVISSVNRYPAVLKPARSVGGEEGSQQKFGVSYAADADDLKDQLTSADSRAFPILVQEKISGHGAGIFLLRRSGVTHAFFAHERILEKPPSGGVSVLRHSTDTDPELLRQAEALLDGFDWDGVAMVEFKVDTSSGISYLMEVNGRFWGSLQLAIDSGVDFPVLLVETWDSGGSTPATPRYRKDVAVRWEWGEVDHHLIRFKGGDGLIHLLKAGWSALPVRPGVKSEVFRGSDPRPWIRESGRWLSQLVGRSNR